MAVAAIHESLTGMRRPASRSASRNAAHVWATRASIGNGHAAFSEADVAFHEIVAQASGNMLIQVCGEVVRDVVLRLIESKLNKAPDRAELMHQSLRHHTEVFEAVRQGDGAQAARLARANLYEYYASYVPDDQRPMLEALIDADVLD